MSYFHETAPVLANDADGDACLLRLRAPQIAAAVRPFQFVLAQVPGGGHLLRRPFSVFDAVGEELELLIRPVGAGTRTLAAVAAGDSIDLTGPFGRTFEPPADTLFVAGGVGIAGLFFALATAARAGVTPALVFGARAAGQLCGSSRLREVNIDITFVTEDGSRGSRGLVTEHISLAATPAALVACGPRAMYRALLGVVGEDTPVYVLMEEHMACGVAACRGCAVPAKSPPGTYICVCQDGPLLDAALIDWDRLEGTP